jgi:ADP-ribose pyrophosphatase YjhB (NUDIX family)
MPYVPPHLRLSKENSTLKKENRYKAVIVPKHGNKYVVVRNNKSKNLTFPVGGCKKSEFLENCARRELSEETRKTIQARNLKRIHEFTANRSKRELDKNKKERKNVTMHYIVFMTNVSNINMKKVLQNFKNESFIKNLTGNNRKSHLETTNINVKSLNEIEKNTLWTLMRNKVVPTLRTYRGL